MKSFLAAIGVLGIALFLYGIFKVGEQSETKTSTKAVETAFTEGPSTSPPVELPKRVEPFHVTYNGLAYRGSSVDDFGLAIVAISEQPAISTPLGAVKANGK